MRERSQANDGKHPKLKDRALTARPLGDVCKPKKFSSRLAFDVREALESARQ